MRVGKLDIDPPLLLAPMAAVTDLPFRTICEEHGVGLTVTEFLSAHALTAGDAKVLAKLTPSRDRRPFAVQIFGRELAPMIRAAEIAVTIGAAAIDINMGCPARRVTAGECGAALMREPALAAEIVRAIIAHVPGDIPVTVKHRAGWDATSRNAPEFAAAMVDAGAAMITVHGRTRKQGFSGTVDLDIIRQVREVLPPAVPVVGNGDVVDVASYQEMRRVTGCDGVMIGRGARGNPWLFSRIREVAAGRPDPGPPTLTERAAVFRRHVGLIAEVKPGPRLIHEIRKACAWYTKGLRESNALRKRIWTIFDPEAAIRTVDIYFADLLARSGPGLDHPHDGDVAA